MIQAENFVNNPGKNYLFFVKLFDQTEILKNFWITKILLKMILGGFVENIIIFYFFSGKAR